MDPARVREIARKGGASISPEKRAFSQDRTLAARAGKKGGMARHHRHGIEMCETCFTLRAASAAACHVCEPGETT